MSVRQLRVADVPVQPWNNGGGTTRELISWPIGETLFDWRVSVAAIADDGPFSALPGVDRVITVIDGAGFRLCGAGVDQQLAPYQPFAFDGGLPVDCLLTNGRSTALNVMTRRGRGRSAVQVLGRATTTAPTTHGLVLVLTGHWRVDDHELDQGSALWWADRSRSWRLQPGTAGSQIAVITWSTP